MQSIFAMNLHDEATNTRHREVVTKVICMEYHFRPALAEAAYQDLVKWMIYTGGLMLLEGNSPTFFTRIMNEGLGNYMVIKHKDGYLEKWNVAMEKGEYKSVKRTANAVQDELMEQLIESIKNYTFKNDDDDIVKYAETIKTVTLFEQLINFKPKETKKFDKVMGFGYTLICYETYHAIMERIPDNSYAEAAVRALFSATNR